MGWFFGFKLHIIINHLGEIMNFTISTSTTDDRKPLVKLMEDLKHTRHRSPINALENIFSGLVAYMLKPCKPSVNQKKLPWLPLLLISN